MSHGYTPGCSQLGSSSKGIPLLASCQRALSGARLRRRVPIIYTIRAIEFDMPPLDGGVSNPPPPRVSTRCTGATAGPRGHCEGCDGHVPSTDLVSIPTVVPTTSGPKPLRDTQPIPPTPDLTALRPSPRALAQCSHTKRARSGRRETAPSQQTHRSPRARNGRAELGLDDRRVRKTHSSAMRASTGGRWVGSRGSRLDPARRDAERWSARLEHHHETPLAQPTARASGSDVDLK